MSLRLATHTADSLYYVSFKSGCMALPLETQRLPFMGKTKHLIFSRVSPTRAFQWVPAYTIRICF